MTNGGTTPLMLACEASNKELINLLLEQGANPFLKDMFDENAEQKLPRHMDNTKQILEVFE